MLLVLTCHHHISIEPNPSPFSVDQFIKNFFLSTLTFFTFQYFNSRSKIESGTNFNDLIWNLFITSTLLYFISFVTKQLSVFFQANTIKDYKLYINLIYHLNLALIAIFIAKSFYTFKRLILYQKSITLLKGWKLFEFSLLTLLFFNFFPLEYFKPINYILIGAISLGGLTLSLNMKWVAYLNFRQKWKNIFLLIIILLISASFLEHIYNHTENSHFALNTYDHHDLYYDLGQKAFIIAVFSFIIFYSTSSALVILFNLPTSSVFEQKIGEVFSIQKLSETIQITNNEEEIYNSLLETSMTTSFADAAWLEIMDNDGKYTDFINLNIEKYEVFDIKKSLKYIGWYKDKKTVVIKDINKKNKLKNFDSQFHSVLVIPLYATSKYLGKLVLLKKEQDAFNKEATNISQTLANQASTAIINSRLLKEALINEQYQKERKIAKEVKKKLLDNNNIETTAFDIYTYTKSADDVGGDFFATGQLSNNKFYTVIADISGHGTSAAFNMAQLKGVFQALIVQNIDIKTLLIQANTALSNCLEKNIFLTLTILFIDINKKTVEIGRAGHCPTIYYSATTKTTEYIKTKGLGLGILRNSNYSQHIETYTRNYESNDVILLYTDGLVEAKNNKNEEYGYENVHKTTAKASEKTPVEIVKQSVEAMYDFCGDIIPEDDITCLCIKFN